MSNAASGFRISKALAQSPFLYAVMPSSNGVANAGAIAAISRKPRSVIMRMAA